MTFFEDYKIDGEPMLAPDQDVSLSYADLDSSDSGRDESGVMHRIVVRHRVATFGFNYSVLTAKEYEYMRSLLDGKTEFMFTYKDLNGEFVKTKAYCSNDSITYHNAQLKVYKNFKFNIIEC